MRAKELVYFFLVDFLAAGFLAAGFLAGDFFLAAAGFLAAGFLAGDFLAAAGFLAGDFFLAAAGFLAMVFLTAGFLAFLAAAGFCNKGHRGPTSVQADVARGRCPVARMHKGGRRMVRGRAIADMQVWLRDERSSEPMSGEPLQVAPTLTRSICRRAAQECSMHTVQRALAVRASVKCGGRRTFAGGMIKSAHGGRAETTVSMRPCSESCCVREAASCGGYARALPLTVCDFECSGVYAGDLARKTAASPALPAVQSDLISRAFDAVDSTPGY